MIPVGLTVDVTVLTATAAAAAAVLPSRGFEKIGSSIGETVGGVFEYTNRVSSKRGPIAVGLQDHYLEVTVSCSESRDQVSHHTS